MTGIGIDVQRTSLRIVIAEPVDETLAHHNVTDGARRQIPMLVAADGSWGSAAASNAESASGAGSVAFWRGLYQRLQDHLGGLRPDPRDGCRLTFAVEAGMRDEGTSRSAILDAAGYERVRTIDPADAVLSACLAGHANALGAERILVGVAVGEEAVQVRGVMIGGGRVVAATDGVTIDGVGHGFWRDHLYALLSDRAPEFERGTARLAVNDSIAQFAERLSLAHANEEVAWRGAGSQMLFAPMMVTQRDARTWPRVRIIESALPEAVRAAITQLGTADAVVGIGGIGSIWPFARASLAHVATVLSDHSPIDMVARGASLPMLTGHHDHGARTDVPQPAAPVPEQRSRRESVPPWLRKPGVLTSDERDADA